MGRSNPAAETYTLIAHRFDNLGEEHFSMTSTRSVQMALEHFDLLRGLFADPVGTPAYTLWLFGDEDGEFATLDEDYRNREVMEEATKLAILGISFSKTVEWRSFRDGIASREMN